MELNISSKKIIPNDSMITIATFLKDYNISAQIIETVSSVEHCISSTYNVEKGLNIIFFDTTKDNFKDNFKNIIWPFLKSTFDLNCAFVKYNQEYMGCILNWPGVFTKSNCDII